MPSRAVIVNHRDNKHANVTNKLATRPVPVGCWEILSPISGTFIIRYTIVDRSLKQMPHMCAFILVDHLTL